MIPCGHQSEHLPVYMQNADDTKVLREVLGDHLALQRDIDNLLQCANMNKMTFHPQKCKVLSVGNNSFEPKLPFQLFIYVLCDTLLRYARSKKVA